jgi:hypothetical protein
VTDGIHRKTTEVINSPSVATQKFGSQSPIKPPTRATESSRELGLTAE